MELEVFLQGFGDLFIPSLTEAVEVRKQAGEKDSTPPRLNDQGADPAAGDAPSPTPPEQRPTPASGTSSGAQTGPGGPAKSSVRKEGHLPFGATLLISGPPGAGKTTFAIALARSLMLANKTPEKRRPTLVRNPKRILYFISSEITLTRLQESFRPFGWFGGDDAQRLFHLDHSKPDDDNLYVITPDPATDRPVPSPEELVNDIFGRIAKSLTPSEAKRENKEYIVIVDSITALLKGCVSPADERRQTHELLYRLRALFGKHPQPRKANESEQEAGRLVLTILLAEQDQPSETGAKPSSVEDYLADVVFRLSNKAQPLGRRFRELEIVKSQGVNMIPGEHSWAIVTDSNCDHYMRHPVLRTDVEQLTFQDGGRRPWGTIVIFSRVRMLHKSLGTRSTLLEGRKIHSGTDGLDEMLIGNPEYWLPRTTPEAAEEGAIVEGRTTLVAGPIGAGKTTLCLQFLLNQHELHRAPPAEEPAAVAGGRPLRDFTRREGLFISLNADAVHTVDSVYQHLGKEIKEMDMALNAQDGGGPRGIFKEYPWARHVAVLDFNQSLFDFNHLMAHLHWAITLFQPRRIAFDGVSEWLTTFNKSDATKMLEAIGVLIANHPAYRDTQDAQAKARPPTVFMTFDMNTREDPLAPQATGISADYIIALKQVNLQDEIRKVIYILKSADARHDPTVREITFGNGRAAVRSALDNFNGLLAARPCPAEVLLQLFQENTPEQTFNRWLNRRLRQLSNLTFKSLDFSRSEIGRMFEDFDSRTRFPAADLKILSVDEWWLASQPVPPPSRWQPKLQGIATPPTPAAATTPTRPPAERSALLNLAGMWAFDQEEEAPLAATWRDFWLFEVDKCGPEERADLSTDGAVRYAVPASIDFGLFCVNRRMLEQHRSPFSDEVGKIAARVKWPKDPESAEQQQVRKNATVDLRDYLLDQLPRYWAVPEEVGEHAWFDTTPAASKWPTLVSLMLHLREHRETEAASQFLNLEQNRWGFSFDMGTRETCVCVFFELAWTFGASTHFLQPEAFARNRPACVMALKLLMFLVLERLMPVRASVETTRHSLFSRHFYSTLQSALDLDRWDEQGGKKDDEAQWQNVDWVPPPQRDFSPSLLALPFFPLGFRQRDEDVSQEWLILLEDLEDRLRRLQKRGAGWLEGAEGAGREQRAAALAFWNQQFASLHGGVEARVEKAKSAEPGLSEEQTTLRRLRFLAEESVGALKGLLDPIADPALLQANVGITLPPDLIELMRWHILRIRLLGRPLRGGPPAPPAEGEDPPKAEPVTLKKILEDFDRDALLPATEEQPQPEGERPLTARPAVPSGFGCTGSWMYGIHNSARSASLAREVLQEITSLAAAEERARRGAGIPTRRDFFELHGLDAVPSMDYLNWNQLLRYCASRARRRERVLPQGMQDPARVYKVIQQQMLACLDRAALWAKEYDAPERREHVIAKVTVAAEHAMTVIQASVSTGGAES